METASKHGLEYRLKNQALSSPKCRFAYGTSIEKVLNAFWVWLWKQRQERQIFKKLELGMKAVCLQVSRGSCSIFLQDLSSATVKLRWKGQERGEAAPHRTLGVKGKMPKSQMAIPVRVT